ncbi:uncharacterized protein LOC133320056 [Danaus plexippus]|uniref:uncharacterized protein LOC133320056 n=1 Tax=Danaus plexippus TaxID=13037 RepID=UPI002AAFCA9F|nr:uncharacterized protein LOC133320056 [Danaus plexippus]XP_061382746.1 uncharacterized protein LOC133320056 [Danaus plexippus]
MTERFSDSQMLKLVEIYRDYDCLWNVTSALYKNHDARQSAYKQIAEKLNISGISDKDIPKKIKNLRSSYYQELKKIEKSTRSESDRDSVYKPKVSWFSIADGFLRAFKNKEKTFSNIDENSEIATDTVDFENNNTVLEENDREENSNAADEIIENRVQELTETSSSTFTMPSKLATKKRGKSNKRQDEVHEAIDKINKIAENVTKNTTSLLQNKEDEFDIFGRYIASTLRTLPREFSIIAKTDIQKALSEIQLKALR